MKICPHSPHRSLLSFSTKSKPILVISTPASFLHNFYITLPSLPPPLSLSSTSLSSSSSTTSCSAVMGFPVGYSDLIFPKIFLHVLSLLGLIRKLIIVLFRYLGLHDFLEPDIVWAHPIPEFHSVSAMLIREILPVAKFSDLVDPPDSCAVCLYEFEADDEIRRLTNCRHIYHRGCLDRWMGYDQRTCPLCRTPFIPHDMQAAFNDRLWAASGIPEFYADSDEYPHLSSL